VTNLLRGELLAINDTDLAVLAGISLVAIALFFLFRREILLASFDATFARTIGRDPSRADALLFLLLGSAIAIGVMDAGPLVVFGFLVLPPLAALRVAPGLVSAMAISAAIGAFCSLGGFALAYRVDMPTGPTSVALAAACWLVFTAAARLTHRRRGATRARAAAALLVIGAPGSLGCGLLFGMEPTGPAVSRGTLPDLANGPAISVARFRNETGTALRIPSGNPLAEAKRAIGRSADEDWTVTDALQAQASVELSRRGIAVHDFEEDRAALPEVPADAAAAAQLARAAGRDGPVMIGSLRRFTITGTSMLLVHLDLALVDPGSGELIWSGSAHRPVPVRSALDTREIVIDAAPKIFAEAFGDR
jgi:ABC 3 transport family